MTVVMEELLEAKFSRSEIIESVAPYRVNSVARAYLDLFGRPSA